MTRGSGDVTQSHFCRVGRLENHYLLEWDHPAAMQLAGRLDDVAASALPLTLGHQLERAFEERDPSLWFVQRLEAKVTINASWEPDVMAHAWGRQIARRLLEAMEPTEYGSDVIRFDDRSVYLMQLMIDLAHGGAWSRWYYHQMEGLRQLPDSGAIRSIACDYGSDGREALLRLDPEQMITLLRALTSADAERILRDALPRGLASPGLSDREFRASASLLLSVWRGVSHRLVTSDHRCVALYLCQQALREQPQLANDGLGPLSLAVATALNILRARAGSGSFSSGARTRQSSFARQLAAALRTGDVPRLTEWAGVDGLQNLRPLLSARAEHIEEIVESLAQTLEPDAATSDGRERRFTGFGGAFLLLPILESLPLEEVTEGWVDPDGATSEQALRFLILLRCFGAANHNLVFGDPVLRDVMEIEPAFSRQALEAWRDHLGEAEMAAFREALHRWQQTLSQDAASLALCASEDEGSEPNAPLLLVDCASGIWLDVGFEDGCRVAREFGGAGARVLVTPTAARQCGGDLQGIETVPFDPDGDDLATEVVLCKTVRIREEFEYLSSAWFDRSDPLERLLTVAGQSVMRGFAQRLNGFASSSMPFLWRNFLDVPASVEVEEETGRWVIGLSRPPLDLVLRMSGLSRRTYELSWLDGARIELFGEDP